MDFLIRTFTDPRAFLAVFGVLALVYELSKLLHSLPPRPQFFVRPEFTKSPLDDKRHDLISEVKRHLSPKSKTTHVILLGDFGSGKTCFTQYLYCWLYIRQWRSHSKVILLHFIRGRVDEEIQAIKEERGRTVLLLDGLDEDAAARKNASERYRQLIVATQGFAKVFMTSRLNFWQDEKPDARMSFAENIDSMVLYLALFSPRQIQNYLNKKYRSWVRFGVARRLHARIVANPCFADLSFRPLLLSYMDETLLNAIEDHGHDGVNDPQTAHLDHGLKNIKRRVFEHITGHIFNRKEAGCFRSRLDFDRAMACIAYDMLGNQRTIPFEGFEEYCQKLCSSKGLEIDFTGLGESIQYQAKVIKHRALLVKVGHDVAFAHRAFMEYYAALWIEHAYLTRGDYSFDLHSHEVGEFICFEENGMRFIPGGSCFMGDDEEKHSVKVSSFFMGVSPVTCEEYRRFNPCHREQKNDKEPVVLVSWSDAQSYCEALSKRSGKFYRLPTEAEWEFACRAGSTGDYFRDIDGHEVTEKNLPDYAWFGKKNGPYGGRQLKANYFGLFDVLGNVWEWCQDRYGDHPSGPAEDPEDPEEGHMRVLRGGSWINDGRHCRSAYRGRFEPGDRRVIIGFRLARGLSQAAGSSELG